MAKSDSFTKATHEKIKLLQPHEHTTQTKAILDLILKNILPVANGDSEQIIGDIKTNFWYRIKGCHTGRVLNNSPGFADAAFYTDDSPGHAHRLFKFIGTSEKDYYRIKNYNTGHVLNDYSTRTSHNANFYPDNDPGNMDKLFKLVITSEQDCYRIKNHHTGRVLNDYSSRNPGDDNANFYTDNNPVAPDRLFKFVPVDNPENENILLKKENEKLNQNNNDLIAQINEQKGKIQELERDKDELNTTEACLKLLLPPSTFTLMPYIVTGVVIIGISYAIYGYSVKPLVSSGNIGANLAQQHASKPLQTSAASSISTADDAIKHTVTIDGAIGLLKTLLPSIQQGAMANKDKHSTHIEGAISALETLLDDSGQESIVLAGSYQKFDDGGQS